MTIKRLTQNGQKGSILLIFLLTLPFLILVATYYMRESLTSFQVARFDELHTQAQLAADAGADFAIEQISLDNSWNGTTGQVTLHTDSTTKTTYQATVTSTASKKTIQVIGRTFWPLTSTTPNRSVTISVELRPVTSGSFSVISGEGGLFMSNTSKVVGGDVFINGEVSLANSSQIGLSTAPVNVSVANQNCPNPADATYPRVCNAGESTQPITLSNQAHIYGTVKATNQTTGTGMTNTGLVPNSTVAPQPLPTYDRAAQKAAVTNNITGAAASCSNNQTLTWPANTKITGNVTIGIKCKVTVKGNIWITGTLSMTGQSQLVVDNSVGTVVPNIMIDGSTGASFANSSQLVPNSSNTGFEILTFYSTAGCSPDCASVTGTSLATSRSITTISLTQSATAPNTTFYSYWSQVAISNSGQLGALIGQTIQLSQSGTITFGGSASTGQVVWVPTGYRRG